MNNHPNRSKAKNRVFADVAKATKEAAAPSEPADAVDRSFNGIRDALFDEWDRLRNGKTTPDTAKAAARMADVILASVETQLETLKFAKTHAQAPLLLK